MKKLISLLLALMMLCACALAEEDYEGDPEAEENAFLTLEEFDMYLTDLAGDALAYGVQSTQVNPDSGVTTVTYADGAELYIADEELTDKTAVIGARLNTMQEDLRGIRLGDSLYDVLGVYPNDNPDLTGTYYDAALYVSDQRPEASVGYLLRDGQQVTEVTHLVFAWEDGGVVCCGITYTIQQEQVVGIEITGLGGLRPEEEALEQLSNVAQMQEMREFTPYPTSLLGADLKPFDEEDLLFSGLDFTALTNESAVAALGETPVDDWMEDSTGEFLRTRQWDNVSIVFRYDAQKNFIAVDSLAVTGSGFEGPRGVRIEDMMDSVMNRFLHGNTEPLGDGFSLYGDGENAPYAVLAYGETTATLTYALRTQLGQTVIWNLTFVDGALQSHRMLLR